MTQSRCCPIRVLLATILLSLGLIGCANQQTAAKISRPAPTAQRVELFNLTRRTSAEDGSPQITGEELLAKLPIAQHGTGERGQVLRLVRRFPDAALETLRNTAAAEIRQETRVSLATAYDQAFVTNGASHWASEFAQASIKMRQFESLLQSRQQALQWIEMGRPEQVATNDSISTGSSFPLMTAEALRVRVIAFLLCEKADEALRECRLAQTLARGDCSFYSELCLLESLILQRMGDETSSAQRWSDAAVSACPVHDPVLWQRLIDVRAEKSWAWPVEVSQAFHVTSLEPATAPVAADHSGSHATEGAIWVQIGEWRLARGETTTALLAFKHAETLSNIAGPSAEARIGQARSLLAMNQAGAAVGILSALIANPDPRVSHHAMAVLANAHLEQNDLTGALALLRSAVDGDQAFPPSQRALARADLGLVLLMSSNEKEGLSWLHEAQSDFEQTADDGNLLQSLENEAMYFESLGRTQESEPLRAKAALLAEKG